MFLAELVTVAKRQKLPSCPSTDEGMRKMWSIHTMDYYSALKRREILTPATTWMYLEDVILSEIKQTQQDKYCMIPLI